MKIHTANVFGQCPQCPKKFKTGRVLLQHLRKVHNYSEEDLKNVASNSVLFSHKKYLDLLKPEENSEISSKNFYCEICGKQFTFKDKLKLHINAEHQGQKSLSCDSCKKFFNSLSSLENHNCGAKQATEQVPPDLLDPLAVALEDPIIKDPINGFIPAPVEPAMEVNVKQIIRSYISPAAQHSKESQIIIVQNPGEQMWEDPGTNIETTTFELVLDESFTQSETNKVTPQPSLTTEAASSGSVFPCVVCGKSFGKRSNLKSHLGLHNKDDCKHKCDDCDQTFAWKSSLNRHKEKVHMQSGDIEFSCDFCPRKFKLQSILKDHVKRDHFEERKHQCDMCSKTFYKLHDLNYHRRLHLSIKSLFGV